MVKVKLIDPALGKHDPAKGREHGRVVPALGDRFVASGEELDVPDEIAGTEPFWTPYDPEAHGYDYSHFETRANEKNQLELRHLGAGLLAQTDIWVRVANKKGDA